MARVKKHRCNVQLLINKNNNNVEIMYKVLKQNHP